MKLSSLSQHAIVLSCGLILAGAAHAQSCSGYDVLVCQSAETIDLGKGTNAASEARKDGAPVGYSRDAHAAKRDLFLDRSEIESLPDLVDSLLNAIAKLSSYEKPGAPPRVSKVSRAQIERTVCRGLCAVKAWYLPGEGIFLDDALAPETNLVHRSILLHELVHFVQEANATGASLDACNRWLQREREAYQVQNEYLVRIGRSSGYPLMVSNQIWVSTNRNVCAGWERGIEGHPAEAPQVFR